MCVDELFEHGISMVKTVWHKRGDKISKQEVKKMVATDVRSKTHFEVEETDDE